MAASFGQGPLSLSLSVAARLAGWGDRSQEKYVQAVNNHHGYNNALLI